MPGNRKSEHYSLSLNERNFRGEKTTCFVHEEVLDSWKKVENVVVSLSSVGLAVGDEAAQEARATVASAQSLLGEMFPAVIATLHAEDEDVRTATLPFLQAYTNKLRHTLKRVGALPEVYPSQLDLLLVRADDLLDATELYPRCLAALSLPLGHYASICHLPYSGFEFITGTAQPQDVI